MLFDPSEGSENATGSGKGGEIGRSIEIENGSRGSNVISGKIAEIEDNSISRSSSMSIVSSVIFWHPLDCYEPYGIRSAHMVEENIYRKVVSLKE